MKRIVSRVVLTAALAASSLVSPVALRAESQPAGEIRAEAIKDQALQGFRDGKWSETSELITKAAQVSNDPQLARMSQWIAQFEAQRRSFAAERLKQYEEAVADVNKLRDAGHEAFALRAAARAYVLADDKEKFHDQQWVKDLITKSVALAGEFEQACNWVAASQVYQDLGAIEPANPLWKERLKLVTRRIRLLGTYAPDNLKAQADAEIERRLAADAILKPTTQPTTKPTTEPNDSFRIEWRDMVKGIQVEMLRDALRHARRNYWRDVSYVDLLTGGLEGMRAVATTPGLEVAFPKLADATRRELFVTAVNGLLADVAKAKSPNDDSLMGSTITLLWQANRESIDLPESVFASEFADGAFAKLDDFTSMIWPYDVEEFNKSTQGEFQGVGIQIDLEEDGSLKVVSPLEDTPAFRHGIKAGDIITHINGKNAKGITVSQAVKNITGPAGTTVQLTVLSPDGTTKVYDIKRETIKVASVKGWFHKPGGGWDYMIDPEQKIGYIRLTNFTKSTTDEMRYALNDLRAAGARALILDLRYNPGGLLNAATEVCDRFLPGGDIVSTRSDREQSGPPPIVAGFDKDDVDLPMVVLVNQYSASASEIVSGALRDHKRALIVGERTFGKGSVQMLFQVDGRSAFLKLTTSHYYLPGGTCIHRDENSEKWGVEPDVTVTMTTEQMRAAIDARSNQDVLRDVNDAAPTTQPLADGATAKKPLLEVDPQLSAAVLMLRLQLAGGGHM